MPTLTLAYVNPPDVFGVTRRSCHTDESFLVFWALQKVFRDNREQYDEIIRSHVKQQLDL